MQAAAVTGSSLPRDLALTTDARRGPPPAPITGAGTARKLDVGRGVVVALDRDEARLTEFRRRLDGSGEVLDDSGSAAVVVVVVCSLLGGSTTCVGRGATHVVRGARSVVTAGGPSPAAVNDAARCPKRCRDDATAATAAADWWTGSLPRHSTPPL